MMNWFGKPGGAPYERDCPHVPTPVGQACAWCDEPIAADDDGVLIPHVSAEKTVPRPMHYECQLRSILGGVNHLRGRCTCCGGSEPPDPPELTRREAAKAAAGWRTLMRGM
jgi:hypothetical protein